MLGRDQFRLSRREKNAQKTRVQRVRKERVQQKFTLYITGFFLNCQADLGYYREVAALGVALKVTEESAFHHA
jgi:hypothetical protein